MGVYTIFFMVIENGETIPPLYKEGGHAPFTLVPHLLMPMTTGLRLKPYIQEDVHLGHVHNSLLKQFPVTYWYLISVISLGIHTLQIVCFSHMPTDSYP